MFRRMLFGLAAFGLLAPALAQDAPRTERVQFAPGASAKAIAGRIKGYDGVRYLVGAEAGQTLTVTLKSTNASTNFNVTAPGADAALFVGSTSGKRFSRKLAASGDHVVDVYLMRNAARRGETASYTLTVGVH